MKHAVFSLIWIGMISLVWAQGPFEKTSSVLATGEWVKIGCTERGIYKLDANFFNSIGFSTASIDPAQIQIFGNGGAMLPQSNAAPRSDDLVENAIWVQGGEDGRFDPEDYVLFYGLGTTDWTYNGEEDQFHHQVNYYSDTSFYFIRLGDSPSKRLQRVEDSPEIEQEGSRLRSYLAYEKEQDNLLGGSGRHWMGEMFDNQTSRSFSFYLPDADPAGQIRVTIRVAARAGRSTNFQFTAKGDALGSIEVPGTSLGSETVDHYRMRERLFFLGADDLIQDSLRIDFEYQKGGASPASGWLDWIEIDYDVLPDARNSREVALVGDENAVLSHRVTFRNGTAEDQIWDVSNPLEPKIQPADLQGNQMSFFARYRGTRTYVVANGQYLEPITFSRVANQDLHGLKPVEYLVIAHPLFLPAAERLTAFHQSHYQRTTAIATPGQIFNEFSSGKLDPTAIRDFIRMMYVRSNGEFPKHVLLFGDGSYDPKNIRGRDFIHNFVPTYQSNNSWNPPRSFTSDDFYVLLDEEEGDWGEGTRVNGDNQRQINFLDAGIGRLPTVSTNEASRIVDKIIDYATNSAGLGNWRSKVVLVADHKPEDQNVHISQANNYTSQITQADPCIQVDKYFMDNYELVPTASRPSFPEGRAALLKAFDEGSLLVNYTGHGGETAWSDASIFTNTDIQRMKNGKRLPAVVTATCEFGKFDNPELRSGAEEMLLIEEGGAIALLTTVRLVFSNDNNRLNQSFYNSVFEFNEQEGRMPTLGEIMVQTKNKTFPLTDINSRNFTLLGDPGLILNYPRLNAAITHINGNPIDSAVEDTLNSLSVVSVGGQIQDASGQQIPSFEGDMEVVIFDKPTRFETRQFNFPFFWQQNRIFDGSATISNGEFNFQFMVPIDISYDEGRGKMSLYFSNEQVDGSGCYSNFSLGGTADQVSPDNTGPEVRLFLNDDSWVDGGLTGPSPTLIGQLSDPSGINTVGGGIGHEIIGILDGNESDVILLNNFYTADPNTFTSGQVNYPLEGLEPGDHSLTLRVWDGANNPTEVTTNFRVANGPQDALGRIANVPNPFSGQTTFFVNHNQAGRLLRIAVNIYTLTGQKVQSLQDEFVAVGNSYQGLTWEGTGFQGNNLVEGIYIYEVIVTDRDTQEEARKVERLVLRR
ncbi:MAG: type IX secretion system sortase PorU [Bacteroidota bacterium]